MSSFLNSIFGSKPTVPKLPSLSLGAEQQLAIKNNQAALPGSEALIGQANLFNQQQITQMLESVTPGFSSMVASASGNIESMLKGQVPTDVSEAVTRSSAARALGGGYAGSGMHGDLVARDLGMTSLQLTQQGLSSAESWLSTMDRIYAPGTMSVASMFVSPGQQSNFDVEERNAQFQRQWMQSQISAMPDPVLSGINAEVMSLASSYLGGSGDMGWLKSNPYSSVGSGGGMGGMGGGMGGYSDASGAAGLYDTGGDMGGGMMDGGGGGFGGGFGGFA